jgi:glutathione synthase
MKLAFVADPLPSFKIHKDSTYAMMVEAAKRGHELYFMLQEGLMWKGSRVIGETSRLALTGDKAKNSRSRNTRSSPRRRW